VTTTGIIATDHPTTAGVSSVAVYMAYPVTGDGTPLIEEQDFVVAMAKEVGQGRVFAYGDERSTVVSEWAAERDDEALWTNVLGWLAQPGGCQFPN
jgi:hypothetical protein